jgi:hypothetical protein
VTLDKYLLEVREREGKASKEVQALCDGKRFLMSIPVREDVDSDCVLSAALNDNERLVKMVEVAREALQIVAEETTEKGFAFKVDNKAARSALAELDRLASGEK